MFTNLTPERDGDSVIRLEYCNGIYTESVHRIKKFNNQTKRLSFEHGEKPHESLFNGLNYWRLDQFHFYRPNAAVLMRPSGWFGEHTRAWFRQRVNRLIRKGLLSSKPVEQESVPAIDKVHTACKNCVFAQYAGKTQTGCQLGRTDLYASRSQLVEACDSDSEFYVVNGTKCMAYRDQAWKDQSQESPEKRVRDELKVKLDFVIPLEVDVNFEELKTTLESLRGTAHSVAVINNQGVVSTPRLHAWLATEGTGLPWTLTEILEREKYGSAVSTWRAIDLTVTKLKGHFYTVIRPGQTPPENFGEVINDAIVNKLSTFSVLGHPHLLTVAHGFHRSPIIAGNRPFMASAFDTEGEPETPEANDVLLSNIVEKAIWLAIFKGMNGLFTTWEQLCS